MADKTTITDGVLLHTKREIYDYKYYLTTGKTTDTAKYVSFTDSSQSGFYLIWPVRFTGVEPEELFYEGLANAYALNSNNLPITFMETNYPDHEWVSTSDHTVVYAKGASKLKIINQNTESSAEETTEKEYSFWALPDSIKICLCGGNSYTLSTVAPGKFKSGDCCIYVKYESISGQGVREIKYRTIYSIDIPKEKSGDSFLVTPFVPYSIILNPQQMILTETITKRT